MSETRLWPLDPTTLKKGDYLTPDFCEERVACKNRMHPQYSLQLMALADWIETARLQIGQPLIPRIEKLGIRICTDVQASEVCDDRIGRAFRSSRRNHRRMMTVDVGNLDDDSRKVHLRQLELRGKQVYAVHRVAHEFRLASHKRSTPSMAPVKKKKDEE